MSWIKGYRTKSRTIEVECYECAGTGILPGVNGRDDIAIICEECEGTGMETVYYVPFSSRRKVKGIIRIFIKPFQFGKGPSGSYISYKDF